MRQYKGSQYHQPDGACLLSPVSTDAVVMHGLNKSMCLEDQCALTMHQPLSVCNGLCLAMTHLFFPALLGWWPLKGLTKAGTALNFTWVTLSHPPVQEPRTHVPSYLPNRRTEEEIIDCDFHCCRM